MFADGLADMTDFVYDRMKGQDGEVRGRAGFMGRGFDSWEEVVRAVKVPDDQDLLFEVSNMTEQVRKEVPPPKSRRRVRERSKVTGSLNLTRTLGGSPDVFDRTVRRNRSQSQHLTIVCNVGNTAAWTAAQIFWRGAAAIAAVDLLEAAGYSCEVWTYNNARDVYFDSSGIGGTFLCACRVKAAGDVLDVPGMVVGTSAWFFRSVIFGARTCHPSRTTWFGAGSSHPYLGGWVKYIDPAPGTSPVVMPAPRTRAAAVEAARKMVEQATGGENSEPA